MATKKQSKCYICGKPIDETDEKNPKIKYKTHWVHNDCLNSGLGFLRNEKEAQLAEKSKETKRGRKNTATKPKVEKRTEPVSQEEYEDKKQYYDYLRMLLNTEEHTLPAKIYALTEKYVDLYSLTYEDLYHTLVYMHEIIEKDLTGDIVGIIPYYCDQAMTYYKELKQVEENNKNIDTSKMYQQKTIVISSKKRRIKQIDITSVG